MSTGNPFHPSIWQNLHPTNVSDRWHVPTNNNVTDGVARKLGELYGSLLVHRLDTQFHMSCEKEKKG